MNDSLKISLKVAPIVFFFTLAVLLTMKGWYLTSTGLLLVALLYGLFLMEGFRSGAARLGGSFLRGSADLAIRGWHWSRPRLNRAGRAAVVHGRVAARSWWAKILSSPAFWAGIFTSAFAVWSFWGAYTEHDSKRLHLGLLLSGLATSLFITHCEKWGDLWKALREKPSIAWLIFSLAGVATTLGHALYLHDEEWWYLFGVSVTSTFLAIVTVAEGLGKVWGAVGELFSFILGLFIGSNGGRIAIFCWAFFFALIAIFFFGKNLVDPDEDSVGVMAAAYGGFLILGFVGVGILICWPVIKERMKK